MFVVVGGELLAVSNVLQGLENSDANCKFVLWLATHLPQR
jgi:hypothetical protein